MEDHKSPVSTSEIPKAKAFDGGFNIKEEVMKYLFHWKWIVFSILVCMLAAIMYLRYTTPLFSASTTILVKDERKGGLDSELSAFEDLGLGKGVKSNVDNETQIMTSRTIVENAIRRLNLNISYYTQGRVRVTEMYNTSPVICTAYDTDGLFYERSSAVSVNGIDANTYELFNAGGTSLGKFRYGQLIGMKHCKIAIQKNPNKGYFVSDYSVRIVFSKLTNVVAKYKNGLDVVSKVRNSSVIEITLADPVREKAEDLLDALIQIYNEDAIADKNLVAQKTEEFIEQRIDLISKQLGDVEKDAESYKKSNRVTDITSQAGMYMQNAVLYEKALIDVGTQISVTKSMLDYMKKIGKDDLAPINVIPIENMASTLLGEYNKSVIDKIKLAKAGTEKNSTIINLEKKIAEMRTNIIESLETQIGVLEIRQRDLQYQNSLMTGKISEIPTQEREFRIIDRQRNIKESLYLYLLQKREEIAISLKVTPPNAKVIDLAKASESPISPKSNMIYLIAFGIGLVVPLGIIYLIQMLDTKVRRRQDVEAVTDIPFLGNIPRLANPENIINNSERSGAAEAIRIVRTNLEFMLAGKGGNGKAKTLLVTSTLPKEGKTSIAVNLAVTIAMGGKRVLLMGLDVRNPKIQNYIKVPPAGFTNFISQEGGSISDYINKVPEYDNLYVLPSGVIPPNPVELLMNDKVDAAFSLLKEQFDYLIVDTAPVSLVTDTLLIAKHADVSIFVIRANYFEKRLLQLAQTFYEEHKLPNMAVVLNDTVKGKTHGYGGYGYGDYGYGYGATEVVAKPWWKQIFEKKA
ncbi:GumC family protein [Flavobacterium silvaticum]|uniref:non-specific protein-tyrosine kinase n=1 Tax=Flavobacterium silvaticum TaxID=1852020 RepID=A0A972FPJ1_9FLAO|nr:polysaccharide biosynthesis tyrosine autokinase [Flavobacterium silvaticum]NMH29493.1 polysaccharide biosynthesis tyrosine autokinase [Flavobacterium silvaticum]